MSKIKLKKITEELPPYAEPFLALMRDPYTNASLYVVVERLQEFDTFTECHDIYCTAIDKSVYFDVEEIEGWISCDELDVLFGVKDSEN